MSEDRRTAVVIVGFGQGSKVNSVSTANGQEMTHIREFPNSHHHICNPKTVDRGRGWCGRPMHQSTLTLGDQAETTYTTTQTESYSGRGNDGRPLIFLPRDPQYPSQHYGRLDLSNTSTVQTLTHNRDVYGPKDIIPQKALHSQGVRNWTRNREGLVMKEITNPPEHTPYRTTYHAEHSSPDTNRLQSASRTGQPTLWHRHDILTGEERVPAGPGKAKRQSGERVLWAAQCWKTDCSSLRLN